jgi:hypothetical protein
MAPYPQIFSRDTTDDGSDPSNPVTPEVIAGIVFACSIILGVCLWLGIRYYRMRTRQPSDIIVKGVLSEGDEKAIPRCVSLVIPHSFRREWPLIFHRYRINVKGPPGQFSRDQLTASIILPNQQIIRPDATKDEIMRYHMGSGTMTRPFSAAASTLAPPTSPKFPSSSRPISVVSFQSAAGGNLSPRRTSFFSFGNRRSSVASSVSNVSSMFGVEGPQGPPTV